MLFYVFLIYNVMQQVTCKLKSVEKDLYRKQYSPKFVFTFLLQNVSHVYQTTLSCCIDKLYGHANNLNTRNFKSIPSNHEKYKLNMMRFFFFFFFLWFSICNFDSVCFEKFAWNICFHLLKLNREFLKNDYMYCYVSFNY